MTDCLLTLLFPAALQERVCDVLLALPAIVTFASTASALHGLAPARLSTREQVLGHAATMRVDALIAAADQRAVLESLQDRLAGTGLRYWTTAILASGEIA